MCKIFLKKKQTCFKNIEIGCINNEGRTAKNKWENDSDFLPVLNIVYKKLGEFFFDTLLAN